MPKAKRRKIYPYIIVNIEPGYSLSFLLTGEITPQCCFIALGWTKTGKGLVYIHTETKGEIMRNKNMNPVSCILGYLFTDSSGTIWLGVGRWYLERLYCYFCLLPKQTNGLDFPLDNEDSNSLLFSICLFPQGYMWLMAC